MYMVYFEMYDINMKCYYNQEECEKKKLDKDDVELCAHLG